MPSGKAKQILSCDPCRRRKLKCDRGEPCGPCQDRDEADLCRWASGITPSRNRRFEPNDTSLQAIAQELTRELRELKEHTQVLAQKLSPQEDQKSSEGPLPDAQSLVSLVEYFLQHHTSTFVSMLLDRERLRADCQSLTAMSPSTLSSDPLALAHILVLASLAALHRAASGDLGLATRLWRQGRTAIKQWESDEPDAGGEKATVAARVHLFAIFAAQSLATGSAYRRALIDGIQYMYGIGLLGLQFTSSASWQLWRVLCLVDWISPQVYHQGTHLIQSQALDSSSSVDGDGEGDKDPYFSAAAGDGVPEAEWTSWSRPCESIAEMHRAVNTSQHFNQEKKHALRRKLNCLEENASRGLVQVAEPLRAWAQLQICLGIFKQSRLEALQAMQKAVIQGQRLGQSEIAPTIAICVQVFERCQGVVSYSNGIPAGKAISPLLPVIQPASAAAFLTKLLMAHAQLSQATMAGTGLIRALEYVEGIEKSLVALSHESPLASERLQMLQRCH